ncbi:hypothetical protein [Pseudomonas chlororaphis]|uniref:CheA signal transduction histidine kinase n=1 Tax=Pseudomonas chlororaphis TaxID=587753 RepID=A0A0D5XWE6_9PSED|nr:hypothetical protein [Pseudomonas chlororaphis]AKA23416.1 hypothetical protein PCL1606_19610 [Pseudomonas chlororaphis]
MLNDDKEWHLPSDFLLEAETLLAKSVECLNHLNLIKNDRDAIDCMLATLLKLAEKTDALALRCTAEFSRQVHALLDHSHSYPDMNEQILGTLGDCFTLMAWQLELVDPVTGQLNLDDNEQATLIESLAVQIDPLHAPLSCQQSSFNVFSIAKRNA